MPHEEDKTMETIFSYKKKEQIVKCQGIEHGIRCSVCPLHDESVEARNLTCPVMRKSLNIVDEDTSYRADKLKPPKKTMVDIQNDDRHLKAMLRHGMRYKDFRFSFVNGLVFESRKNAYAVKIYNLDTGNLMTTVKTVPNLPYYSPHKFNVRYGLKLFRGKKQVFSYDMDLNGKNVLVWSLSRLVGDNFAWIDSVLRFKKKYNCNVTCAVPPMLLEPFSLTFPEIEFVSNKDSKFRCDLYYARYYLLAGGNESKFSSVVNHKIARLNDIPNYILNVEGSDEVRKFVATENVAFPNGRKYVCYSESASSKMKEWGNKKALLEVIRYLQGLGYLVVNIDVKPKTKDIDGVVYQNGEGYSIQDRINTLSNAEFLICNPSGLGWVARSCGIPVVMVGSFCLPVSEWNNPYRVFNTDFCFGCWNYAAYAMQCLRTADKYICNRSITAKQVIDMIDKLLNDKKKENGK